MGLRFGGVGDWFLDTAKESEEPKESEFYVAQLLQFPQYVEFGESVHMTDKYVNMILLSRAVIAHSYVIIHWKYRESRK